MRGTNRPPSSAIKEALLLIAARKLAPTPLNIALAHQEIEGRNPDGLIICADLEAGLAQAGVKLPSSSLGAQELVAALAGQGPNPPWRAALSATAAALRAFAQDRPELAGEIDALANAGSQDAARWADVARRCQHAASVDNGAREALRAFLGALGERMSDLAGEEELGQAPAQILSRLAKPGPLTPTAILEAQEALDSLAQSRSRAQGALRARKAQLHEALLDLLRGMSESSAGLDAQSHRVGALAQSALELAPDPLARQALTPLASEANALAEGMRAASARLRQGEQAVAGAQAEIESLRGELARASRQAREDSLTGVLNRRGLDEAAAPLLERAAQGEPLVAALLDLDDFRAVNDALGHDGGDQALRHLSATLGSCLRPQDVVARFGGEEFVILLPGLSLAQAKEALIRAQRALTKDLWMHGRQKLLTFSSGASAWREGDDLAKMLSRADQLMYQAKKNGKNRVFADGDA